MDKVMQDLDRPYMAMTNDAATDATTRTRAVTSLNMMRENVRNVRARMNADVNWHITVKVLALRYFALCEAMQEKLPRELRDSVYGYLSDDSVIEISQLDLSNFWIPRFGKVSPLRAYAHVLSADWADKHTRVEFAESWYKSTSFRLTHPQEFFSLLHRDHWGLGLDLYGLVRSLMVRICLKKQYLDATQGLGTVCETC
jgi:hypothetical protein